MTRESKSLLCLEKPSPNWSFCLTRETKSGCYKEPGPISSATHRQVEKPKGERRRRRLTLGKAHIFNTASTLAKFVRDIRQRIRPDDVKPTGM